MIKTSRRDKYIYDKIKELESVNNNAVWGNITGTLSNQTDLQNTLNSKENLLPDKSGKAGKFLKVNTVETGYEWADAGSSFSGTLDDIPDGTTYKRVTQTEKNTWNNKSDFSGSYTDLEDIPSSFPPDLHGHSTSAISGLESLEYYERKFQKVDIINGNGYNVNQNQNNIIYINIPTLEDNPNSIQFPGTSNDNDTDFSITIIKIVAINTSISQLLDFGNKLDVNGANITLTNADNGKAFIFFYYKGYWRTVYNPNHTHTKSNITDFIHQSSHQSGGSDALSGNLDATARTTVRKNSGADIGSRRRLNFIEGSNITLTIADDSVNEEVDVTINASASGGVTIAQRTLTADETKTNDTSMQGWFNNNNRLLLDANSIYEFEGMFSSLNGSTSHGLNMQFDAISGATIRWTSIGSKVNETTQATATRVLSTNTFDTARNVTTASTVTGNVVWVRGIIVTGASGGYFAPKVAQTAASGSFVVKAGTYMKVRKVGINTDTNIGGWTT